LEDAAEVDGEVSGLGVSGMGLMRSGKGERKGMEREGERGRAGRQEEAGWGLRSEW